MYLYDFFDENRISMWNNLILSYQYIFNPWNTGVLKSCVKIDEQKSFPESEIYKNVSIAKWHSLTSQDFIKMHLNDE